MRVELTNLGLMENHDMEYDQPHLREDDQICGELRYQQQALRNHIRDREAATTASRKALHARIQEGLPRERILADVYVASKQLEVGFFVLSLWACHRSNCGGLGRGFHGVVFACFLHAAWNANREI